MSTAHPDNGGIQVFSRTQTAEQIQEALSSQGYEGFEAVTLSTAPLKTEPPTEEKKPEGEAPAESAAPVEGEAVRHAKPGKRERQLARAQKELAEMRERETKRDLEMAELRGMIAGKASSAAPVPVVTAPKVEAAPVVVEEVKTAVAEPPKLKERPKRDQFLDAEDPDTAYEDALGEYTYERRRAVERAEEADKIRREAEKKATESRQAANDAFQKRWNTSMDEARDSFKDFDEVWKKDHVDKEGKPLPIVSGPMTHVAQNRKVGAKILYWLATHPEQANEIYRKTNVAPSAAPWEIEEAFGEVRREFDRIEQELSAPVPDTEKSAADKKAVEKPVVEKKAAALEPEEDDDDPNDEDEDDELQVDPNLSAVTSDPAAGKKVAQGPGPGTVDTKPEASQKAPVAAVGKVEKSEPVARVGNRQTHVNRPILGTPPEVVKQLTPDEYRKKRILEGSTAARG